ncbi:MAG: hypothetical protein LH605_04020, partial [Microbacteriaceae bacterium]|nr:hypothetical protein [Microbacteriaceae bacterium]
MRRWRSAATVIMAVVLLTGCTTGASESASDEAPPNSGRPTEDVTEWFDGNDNNPSDEKFGRWDDEVYQADKDTGTDVDSDWYGYST